MIEARPLTRPLIVRLRNFVGDTVLSIPALRLLESHGYRLELVGKGWARGLLEQEMVPMFLLLPQVKLAKRLDVRGAAERGLRRLPGRFVAAWERESGRTA
eukprot:gene45289-55407_t